jgi:NTE family protein
MNKKGLAVVLSGGAARAVAHVGVLHALDEEGIRPDAVSGVSGGAIVGAFYCHGYAPKEILEMIKGTSIIRALRPTRSTGLLKLDKAEEIFRKYLTETTFEKLQIPLYISACDVEDPQILVFSGGDLIQPLLASCALPPVFKPVEISGRLLADAGLLNNLPVKPVQDFAKILGVNVNLINPEAGRSDSFAQYTEWVIDVIINQNIQDSIRQCHVFWEPPQMRGLHLTDINKAEELFQIGYDYARENLHQVKQLLRD